MTAIEVNNLSVTYGSNTIIRDLNFRVSEGSFVCIVGPNGGGKTTLMKAILGILQPSSGFVRINGNKPTEITADVIGYVPQIKTLDRNFPALPIELVVSGINSRWPKFITANNKFIAMEALRQVGAEHLAGRQLSNLSGGELQRIYLARSLVKKPKLLLLDEPALGIDYLSEKDINKLIDEYRTDSKATVVMVTHDWESAYHHADYVLMLNCTQICFEPPEKAFSEDYLRLTFGHIGHKHDMVFH